MKSENSIKNNWPIAGNGNVINFFKKSLKNDNISGAYLFYGEENLGKSRLAKYLSQVLMCSDRKSEAGACGRCRSCRNFQKESEANFFHGDYHVVEKAEDKKNISIDQVRDLIQNLSMSSFLDSYKIGLIKDAHLLTIEAANALLKTLEEPKNKVVVFLTANNIDNLPETIVSRCQLLRFTPSSVDDIYGYLVEEKNISRTAAKNYARLALGKLAIALKYAEDESFYKNHLKEIDFFVSAVSADLNTRLSEIKNIFSEKKSGQDSVRVAERIIFSWEGIVRDLILSKFEIKELLKNEVIGENLKKLNNISLENLLKIKVQIDEGKKYIAANVSPKLVLEKILINI